jgi:hypothetical protein
MTRWGFSGNSLSLEPLDELVHELPIAIGMRLVLPAALSHQSVAQLVDLVHLFPSLGAERFRAMLALILFASIAISRNMPVGET